MCPGRSPFDPVADRAHDPSGCSQGADGQLRQLAKYCAESKDTTKCALADMSADDIVQKIHKLLDDLYRTPRAYVSREVRPDPITPLPFGT